MKQQIRKLVVGLSVAAMAFSLTATAFGQDDILTKKIPSLNYQQADVREALKALFKQVDASYSINADVQGLVTTSLKDVTFEIALQNILSQADATYRYEAGVFVIVRREAPVAPQGSESPENNTKKPAGIVRRIKVRSADPQLIAMLIGGQGGIQNWQGTPVPSSLMGMMMGGGMMGGGMMGGGMMGGGMMGGGMMGGGMMGGGMMGGGMMGGGMMGGGMMGGGMMGGGFGGMGGGGMMGGGFGGGF